MTVIGLPAIAAASPSPASRAAQPAHVRVPVPAAHASRTPVVVSRTPVVVSRTPVAVSRTPVAAAASPVAGSFVPVTPAKLLDTRTGVGAPRAAVAPGGVVALQVAGRAGVPTRGVSAVLLGLNVTAPGASGALGEYPAGTTPPTSDIMSFAAKTSRAHADVTTLGTGGKIELVNRSTGTIELAVQVSGYYVGGAPTASGAFVPLPATRLLDTSAGIGAPKAPLADDTSLTVTLGGHGGVPSSGVSAVLLNVAAFSAGSGYLTVGAVFLAAPETLPFIPGQVSSNLVVVPVDAQGQVDVTNYSTSAAADVAADAYGYYRGGTPTSAGLFGAVVAQAVQTRAGLPVAARSATAFHVAGAAGAPSTGLRAVVLNIVASIPGAAGSLTVYAKGSKRPAVPNVDFTTDVATSFAVVRVGAGGDVSVYNSSSKLAYVVVNIEGYVGAFPGPLRWSPAHTVAPSVALRNASCATPTFCMGIDDTTSLPYVFNGQSWSRTAAVPSNLPLGEVSCGGTICAATESGLKSNTPALFLYSNGVWTESSLSKAGRGVESVQCVSSTFCAATARDDASGSSTVYLFDGTSWRSTVDPKMNPYADPVLSCVSATFCLGADSDGVIATFDGSVWTDTPAPPAFARYDTDHISCATATFCVLLGDTQATVFTGHGWRGTHTFPGGSGDFAPLGIDCVSSALCIDLDVANELDDYVNGTWRAPVEINPGSPVQSITCAPATLFCLAVDADGSYLTSH